MASERPHVSIDCYEIQMRLPDCHIAYLLVLSKEYGKILYIVYPLIPYEQPVGCHIAEANNSSLACHCSYHVPAVMRCQAHLLPPSYWLLVGSKGTDSPYNP